MGVTRGGRPQYVVRHIDVKLFEPHHSDSYNRRGHAAGNNPSSALFGAPHFQIWTKRLVSAEQYYSNCVTGSACSYTKCSYSKGKPKQRIHPLINVRFGLQSVVHTLSTPHVTVKISSSPSLAAFLSPRIDDTSPPRDRIFVSNPNLFSFPIPLDMAKFLRIRSIHHCDKLLNRRGRQPRGWIPAERGTHHLGRTSLRSPYTSIVVTRSGDIWI